jgi:dTDP-glucose 4,6-dehydratase
MGATNPLAADLDHVLAHTPGIWDDLRGARIFITGGTGFFGCWLLESFAWANDRLGLGASAVVLTRDPAAFARKAPHLAAHPAVTLHRGDVRTFAFPEGPFSHVIHAATIVAGTERVLTGARAVGARRLLFTSSGAVYGRQPADMTHLSEDYAGAPDPTDPSSAYGEGKRAAEQLCAVHAGPDFEPVIARCFAFVGPYLPLDAHFAVGNFIRDALAGGPIRVNGDGTAVRSYLYAADLMVWLWTILIHGRSLRPYNVGSDLSIAVRELADVIAKLSTPRATVEVLGAPRTDGTRSRYVPAIHRAASELKLGVVIRLEDGASRTMKWHRALTAETCI